MNNLLEQASSHVIRVNKLMGEIEGFEGILQKANLPECNICFTSGNGHTPITVLSPEKMQDLKETVLAEITLARNNKTAELEQLLGIRKPAIINPEFDATVQDMIQSTKKSDPVEGKLTEILQVEATRIEDKPEMTVEEVRRLYIDEGKTYKEMADYFGVKKGSINNFIYKNHLAEEKNRSLAAPNPRRECP